MIWVLGRLKHTGSRRSTTRTDGIVLRSEDEIGPAVEAGRKAGGLFVIDARISPTTVSDPYLRSLFGKPAQSPLIQGYWRATQG
jgi:hypothetical protein